MVFKDTGVGISKDKIKILFQDFNASDKLDGTGLGLPFCSKVMKSFNGSISCDSSVGEYTLFRLQFPKEFKPIKDFALIQNTNIKLYKTQKPSILFLDDDIIQITSLQILLEGTDYDLHFESDILKGIEKAKSIQPKLVFTDLNVPELCTEKLIERLNELSPKPKIISLSGQEPNEFIKTQLDGVLLKPITKKELTLTIEKFVRII